MGLSPPCTSKKAKSWNPASSSPLWSARISADHPLPTRAGGTSHNLIPKSLPKMRKALARITADVRILSSSPTQDFLNSKFLILNCSLRNRHSCTLTKLYVQFPQDAKSLVSNHCRRANPQQLPNPRLSQ